MSGVLIVPVALVLLGIRLIGARPMTLAVGARREIRSRAAQLLVLECGLSIELPDAEPFARAPLDLEGRSRVVAAGTPELCRELAAALR